ncbi:MAG: putative bifunctional diguanylate cyclase/phosphodiesterase [Vulcanimicrobiaceae bacterium]
MTFLPILAALVLIWGGFFEFTLAERRSALDHVQSQLASTVSTLADFNELANRSGTDQAAQANASRTEAFWHALLQYPTASFWVESSGRVVAGQPPGRDARPLIVAQDARGAFTVRAALPQADALAEWNGATWQNVAVLFAVTLVFLVMTRFLARALRQRAAADREVAASAERVKQLALYRTQLEETVVRRTEELAQSHSHLEAELVERNITQVVLREHDALLNAVTKSAAELLGSQSHEKGTAAVLRLIGETLWVGRVQLAKIDADGSGHFKSALQSEWCAPEISSLVHDGTLQEIDLTLDFPELIDRMLAEGLASFYVDEIAQPRRELYQQAGIQSVLVVPILVANALWGSLNFIDSSEARREWAWAETDTLKTLAGLLGMAITRAGYVKDLADANTIVQNSPTILYRLRGEPSFPLMYISSNITKFGHDPTTLLRSPDWVEALVDSRDRATVDAAMACMLERGAQGDSIEFRLRTGSGDERWVENRYSPRRDEAGHLLEVEGIIIDIAERKAAEEKIALLARTDSLTGLANRAALLERLRQAFAFTARGARPFAILYLDLDYFKPVNDTLGHAAGDQVLRAVAERLRACTREIDLVARLGGDEFAVLQTEIVQPSDAGILAARILRSLALPYVIKGTDVRISASIGICPHSSDSSGPDEILAQADLALYRSKEQGRNDFRFYSEKLDRQARESVALADDLKKALADGELELFFEPQVELNTDEVAGMKALVRWHHPTRGLLTPDQFIPFLEKTASCMALGHWLLDTACQEMRRRHDYGSALPTIAIDIRFSQLKNGDDLVRDMRETLAKWEIAPADLELDVTEETLAKTTLAQNDTLCRLHELGIKIAIADFGSKCSFFEYLRAYHMSRIKLSQSFISAAGVEPERAAMLHAALRLAEESGLSIATQGRETAEQRGALRLSPCPSVSGHDVGLCGASNLVSPSEERNEPTSLA